MEVFKSDVMAGAETALDTCKSRSPVKDPTVSADSHRLEEIGSFPVM